MKATIDSENIGLMINVDGKYRPILLHPDVFKTVQRVVATVLDGEQVDIPLSMELVLEDRSAETERKAEARASYLNSIGNTSETQPQPLFNGVNYGD